MTDEAGSGVAPRMVTIPRGYFRMGTDAVPAPMYRDEYPGRERVIDEDFQLSVFPITFLDLLPYVRWTRPHPSGFAEFVEQMAATHPRLPAVMISWHQAHAYCDFLTASSGDRFRLPTELEWEYACRAGTTSGYWWGEEFDPSRANCRHSTLAVGSIQLPRSYSEAMDCSRYLTPVDAHAANPWGLHDVLGNVWEWVEDVYIDPRSDPETHAPSRRIEPFRSLRGGSWMDPPLSLRCATRSWADPAAKDRNIGFRVACGTK
jgi:formylglycine-generating enzyme required for sulfatase activity